jgi:hypothetical protein
MVESYLFFVLRLNRGVNQFHQNQIVWFCFEQEIQVIFSFCVFGFSSFCCNVVLRWP